MYECDSEIRRGPWTVDEDNLLIHSITSHGEGRWNSLAKFAGLKRSGKSCRLRWLNYLKPDIKRGNLTPHEQLFILELHSKFGNRWSKIAQHLPGRTDNEIKNYWRTRVQKQARQLNIDSNSTKFLETIRNFFMEPSSSIISTVNDPQNYSAPPSTCTNMLNNSINIPDATAKIHDYSENQVLKINPIISYDMQELDQSQDASLSDCHVEENGWFGEEDFWNTDDHDQFMSQFRKLD